MVQVLGIKVDAVDCYTIWNFPLLSDGTMEGNLRECAACRLTEALIRMFVL